MFFEKSTEDGDTWSVVYDKAIRDDGSLFFPERLTPQFLKQQRRTLGSYIFANQYQNEIIPEGEQDFKKEWLAYYTELPTFKNTFAFIDPAISLEDTADYTAVTVVDVDIHNDWYLKVARRARITATQTIKLIFDIHRLFKPNVIGVEVVAYQKALMHFLDEEMRRRQTVIPVKGIQRGTDRTKEMRIRSLVPRFEWGRISIKQGLAEFEDEYLKFPRGSHDDIMDSLASIEEIAYPPAKIRSTHNVPNPADPEYEKWYIEQLKAGKRPGEG